MKFRIVCMGPIEEPGKQPDQAVPPILERKDKYDVEGTAMVRLDRSTKGVRKVIPIANFTARIVRDFVLDDCPGHRQFEIHALLAGQEKLMIVSAASFQRMTWVLEHLGPQAIVFPGEAQHARAAIQALSGIIPQQRAFSHLGWRKVNEHWVYLDAGGSVSHCGRHSDFEVRLPEALSRFRVLIPDSEDRVPAVRASLELLSLSADRIMLPLLAGVYRAALGSTDFSLFLAGPSGTFKTAIAALCQQHFGAAMDSGHLPAHFESTAGALEELAFLAKDALLVIDDYVPTGIGAGAVHALAERIFRSVGNHYGRNRLNGSSLDSNRPPRAMLLATGEELPRGHSLRARLFTIPIEPGDVDRDCLSRCQKAASQGHLTMAMGAFLTWVTGRYEETRERLRRRAAELRIERLSAEVHARIPTALAELQAGWEIWVEFAAEIAAIDTFQKQELEQRCRIALLQLAGFQVKQSAPPAPERNQTKRSQLVLMLERPEGASVEEMMGVTGWQKHTVFGFLSLLKHRTKLNLESTKAADTDRRYGIVRRQAIRKSSKKKT